MLFFPAKIFFFILLATFSLHAFAQDLPEKIDGYKVHNEMITLSGNASKTPGKPYIVVGTPTVSEVSLGGVTLAIISDLEAAGYDGQVEKMNFRDIKVNGVSVKVEDFTLPFKVSKRGRTVLPAPATVFLPTSNILNAAWKEITNSKQDWSVTGRVFVFGKFKKFGFHFKRAIPVDIDLLIKNPLLEYRKNVLS